MQTQARVDYLSNTGAKTPKYPVFTKCLSSGVNYCVISEKNIIQSLICGHTVQAMMENRQLSFMITSFPEMVTIQLYS